MSLAAAIAELSAAALLLLFLMGATTACSQQFLCLRPLPQGQGLFLQHTHRVRDELPGETIESIAW